MTIEESRIFVTHSSLDAELATAIVEALQLGLDLPSTRVFCSSIEGIGIPTGVDFLRYLQQQLASTGLMVPLITPAYLDSTFCKWELGASWVRQVETFPLIVPQVSFNDLEGPLRTMHVAQFTRQGLDGLATAVGATTGTSRRPVWESKRNSVLETFEGIRPSLEKAWRSTPQAELRRLASHARKYSEAARQLHLSLHRLRDAGFVQMYHQDTSGHVSEFLGHLRQSASALSRYFGTTTGTVCRIAIKQILMIEGDDNLYVQDLTRDTNRISHSTVDLIEENTDFKNLLEGTEDYFFCNDLEELAAQGAYVNSHVSHGTPLPYKSTIVWPIRKVLDDPVAAGYMGAFVPWQDIVGFLCVDSRTSDVFSDHDIEVGSGVADTLYGILRPYLGLPEDYLSEVTAT